MSTLSSEEIAGRSQIAPFRFRMQLTDFWQKSTFARYLRNLDSAFTSSLSLNKYILVGAGALFTIVALKPNALLLWMFGFVAGIVAVAVKTGTLSESLKKRKAEGLSPSNLPDDASVNFLDADNPWLTSSIPATFDHALLRLCDFLLAEFVQKPWYQDLKQNDGFGRELRYCVRFVVAELVRRATHVNLRYTLGSKLPALIANHLNDYISVRNLPLLNDVSVKSRLGKFCRECTTQHAGFTDNPARRLFYYTALADRLTEVLFHTGESRNHTKSVVERLNSIACKIVKRILAAYVITPAVDALCKPRNVNKIIALLLAELNEPPAVPFVSLFDTPVLKRYERPPLKGACIKNFSSLAVVLQNDDVHNLFRRFLRTIDRENLLDFYVRAKFVDKQLAGGEISEHAISRQKDLSLISKGLLRSLQIEVRKLFDDYASPTSPKWIGFRDDEFSSDVARLVGWVADPEAIRQLKNLSSWRRAQQFVYSLLQTEYLPRFQQSVMLYKHIFGPRTDEVEYKFSHLPSFLQLQQQTSFVRNPIGSLTTALVGVFRAVREISANPNAQRQLLELGEDEENPDEFSEIASQTSSSISQHQVITTTVQHRRPSVFHYAETVRSFASDDHPISSQRLVGGGHSSATADRWSTGSHENLSVSSVTKNMPVVEGPYATLGSRESLHDDLTERLYGRLMSTMDRVPQSSSSHSNLGRSGEHNFDLNQLHVCVPTIESRQQRNSDQLYYVYVIKVIAPGIATIGADEPSEVVDKHEEMWYVERKYEEFYVLRAKLREFHGLQCLAHATLPSKRSFLLTPSYQYLSSKKHNMEQFLRLLIAEPRLRKSQLLYSFLTSDVEFNKLYVPDYAASFRLVIPGRTLFQAVPKMLYVEKGQNLRNFINNLGASIVSASGLVPATNAGIGAKSAALANRNYAATRSSICSSNSIGNFFDDERPSQAGENDLVKAAIESRPSNENAGGASIFSVDEEDDELGLEIWSPSEQQRSRSLNHQSTLVAGGRTGGNLDLSSLAASQGYFSHISSGKSRLFDDSGEEPNSRMPDDDRVSLDRSREWASSSLTESENLHDTTLVCRSVSRTDKDTALTQQPTETVLHTSLVRKPLVAVEPEVDPVQFIDVDAKPLLPVNTLLTLIRLIYAPPSCIMQPLTALILQTNGVVDKNWNDLLDQLESYIKQPEHFIPLVDLLIETLAEEGAVVNENEEERKSRNEFREHLQSLHQPYEIVLKLIDAFKLGGKSNSEDFGTVLWETFSALVEKLDSDKIYDGKKEGDLLQRKSSPPSAVVENASDVILECFQCESFNRRLIVVALDALIAALFPEIA